MYQDSCAKRFILAVRGGISTLILPYNNFYWYAKTDSSVSKRTIIRKHVFFSFSIFQTPFVPECNAHNSIHLNRATMCCLSLSFVAIGTIILPPEVKLHFSMGLPLTRIFTGLMALTISNS